MGTARRVAAETNRLLLIHFWAEWCRPCRQMEAEVFSRPDVLSALATNYVAVKVNFDRAPELVREFRIESIPTDVILTPNGELLQKFVGGSSAERYIERISQVAYTYQQRRTMLARTNTPSATPPLTPSYATSPWSSPSPQGTAAATRPVDQPPTMAMNAGVGLPQSGPGGMPPSSQGSYFSGQPLASAPAPVGPGQIPAGPSGFGQPQNQVLPSRQQVCPHGVTVASLPRQAHPLPHLRTHRSRRRPVLLKHTRLRDFFATIVGQCGTVTKFLALHPRWPKGHRHRRQ